MDELVSGLGFGFLLGACIASIVANIVTNEFWEREAVEMGYGEMVLEDRFDKAAEFRWKEPE